MWKTFHLDSGGNANVLPRSPDCGSAGAGNRIYGGVVTELDEFPWMALLQYRRGRIEITFINILSNIIVYKNCRV